MKTEMYQYIDQHYQETLTLASKLFLKPELGYKEFKTREIIKEFLQAHNLNNIQEYCITGLSVTIGSGKPHIGLLAEMDAIPTLGHPFANKEDHAAHACGHSTQVAIMLAVMDCLNQHISELKGTVTLFFTPAEEYTDFDYRTQLIKEGKIKYIGGKQNMIAQGLFDDIDCLIHLHGTGIYQDHRYTVNSTLAGFTHKKFTFVGKTAHAGVCPEAGQNALYMCNLFLNAMNMLRETFVGDDLIRVHGMIDKGGDTVNSIPSEVVYQCYIRSASPKIIEDISQRLDLAAQKCAEAFGGQCIIKDTAGYEPLIPCKLLGEAVYRNIRHFCPTDMILTNGKSAAAGDVGDISMLKPIVQYEYPGFSGQFHGSDFAIVEPETIYKDQPKIIAGTVYDLLENPNTVEKIVNSYKPIMTLQQYLDHLNK